MDKTKSHPWWGGFSSTGVKQVGIGMVWVLCITPYGLLLFW